MTNTPEPHPIAVKSIDNTPVLWEITGGLSMVSLDLAMHDLSNGS